MFNNAINVLLVQLGHTLLHYAAYYGNYDVVRILLENNADADAADKVGVVTATIKTQLKRRWRSTGLKLLHVKKGCCCLIY